MEPLEKVHEYKVEKYTFQEPYETKNVLDEAVSHVLSYNYDTATNLDSSALEKVQLVLSFLKIDTIFQTVVVLDDTRDNMFTKLRKKSGYPVLDSFLNIQLSAASDDKYKIYEGFKKFEEYVSGFDTDLKAKYDEQDRKVAKRWKAKQDKENEEISREAAGCGIVVLLLILGLLLWVTCT